MKYLATIFTILLIAFMVMFVHERIMANKKLTCSSFSSRYEVDRIFNSDRKFYSFLDADHDGIACENITK